MKKFIFTAIMMAAFSMSSFGNSVAIEESSQGKVVIKLRDCYAEAAAEEQRQRNLGAGTEDDYYNAFTATYEACVASGNCIPGN